MSPEQQSEKGNAATNAIPNAMISVADANGNTALSASPTDKPANANAPANAQEAAAALKAEATAAAAEKGPLAKIPAMEIGENYAQAMTRLDAQTRALGGAMANKALVSCIEAGQRAGLKVG